MADHVHLIRSDASLRRKIQYVDFSEVFLSCLMSLGGTHALLIGRFRVRGSRRSVNTIHQPATSVVALIFSTSSAIYGASVLTTHCPWDSTDLLLPIVSHARVLWQDRVSAPV